MFQSFQPFQTFKSCRPFGPSNVQGSTFQDIGQIRSRTAGRTSHSIRAARDLTVATGTKPGLGCQAFPGVPALSWHNTTFGKFPSRETTTASLLSHCRKSRVPVLICKLIKRWGPCIID